MNDVRHFSPEVSAAQRTGLSNVLVAVHLVLGLALILLDPVMAWFRPTGNGGIALRMWFPLLPCIGLFWVLIAAGLVSCRRIVVVLAIVAHRLVQLAAASIGLLSAFLLWASRNRAGHGWERMGFFFGIVVVGISLMIVIVAQVTAIGLWRHSHADRWLPTAMSPTGRDANTESSDR